MTRISYASPQEALTIIYLYCKDTGDSFDVVGSIAPYMVNYVAYKDGQLVGGGGRLGKLGIYLWVHPDYRGGLVGGLLFRKALRDCGGEFYWICSKDKYDSIYKSKGYIVKDYIVSRR